MVLYSTNIQDHRTRGKIVDPICSNKLMTQRRIVSLRTRSRLSCRYTKLNASKVQNQKQDTSPQRQLYDVGDVISDGYLPVTDGHKLYYRVYGNPDAGPVAFYLHGGPGAGCFVRHSTVCDPSKWKIVLFDQRGCGKSTPKSSLNLVEDIERLYEHLGIEDQITLIGGSWGTTLALAYAVTYPHRVSGIVLRGVCLMREQDIAWLFKGKGVQFVEPQAWQGFLSHLEPHERRDPLVSYYNRMTSDDAEIAQQAAKHWMQYEYGVGFNAGIVQNVPDKSAKQGTTQPSAPSQPLVAAREPNSNTQGYSAQNNGSSQDQDSTQSGYPNDNGARGVDVREEGEPDVLTATSLADVVERSEVIASHHQSSCQALLTCHYSIHNGFLQPGLLDDIHRLSSIPCIAVHGQYDHVCPLVVPYSLKAAWPSMKLVVVRGEGHSMYQSGIMHELVQATDEMLQYATKSDDLDTAVVQDQYDCVAHTSATV